MSYGTASVLGAPGSGIPSGSAQAVGGPSSATDNAIVRFDGATGGLIQDSLATIGDSPNTQTSGSQTFLSLAPTYNQSSGTAANTDFLINRTQTAVGSGAQLLADFQVGGTSQVSINNAGLLTFKTGTAITTGIAFGDANFFQTASGIVATNARIRGSASASDYWDVNGMAFNGNTTITFRPGGTQALQLGSSQQATFAGALITTPQALSGAGAVNTTTSATFYTSTGGAQALTLADGTAEGQLKYIVHKVDGGSGVLTPTTKIGFTTITFTNVGDACTLQWTSAGWAIVGIFGAVAA